MGGLNASSDLHFHHFHFHFHVPLAFSAFQVFAYRMAFFYFYLMAQNAKIH